MGASLPCLILVLAENMSLALWEKNGLFGRETELYRRLLPNLGKIVIVSYGGREELKLAERLAGITVICNRWGLKRRIYLALVPWLTFWVTRGFSFRIVKSNQMPGAGLTRAIAKRLSALLIVRCGYHYAGFMARQFGTTSRQAASARLLEERIFPMADRCVVTTKAFRDRLITDYNLSTERVTIIPNYVDTELFADCVSYREAFNRIVFVGRLAPQKNLSCLFDALQGTGISIDIAGDGPLQEELEQQARRLGVSARFHGRVPHEELPDLFRSADAFVLPSLYEGHPKALLEAMAAGLPVIGTAVPGIQECIRNGETGLLSPPTSKGIREALMSLALNTDLRRRLGQTAQLEIARSISLDLTIKKELALYRELLGLGAMS